LAVGCAVDGAIRTRKSICKAWIQRVSGNLLSFGGAWSNHLHALAALGASAGMATVGVVRGELTGALTPTLQDCLDWGMQLVPLSRADYRRRHEPAFQRALLARHGPALLVPEGGDCAEGARGCLAIGREVARVFPRGATVILAVGTGTTLAGVAAALGSAYRVLGISALKGAHDLASRVQRNIDALGGTAARWEIRHEFHCGGFARTTPELRQLIHHAEHNLALPLEPVYTGKALLALRQLLERGEIDRCLPMVLLHTGGLQGRRGFPWLARQAGETRSVRGAVLPASIHR
jgi:1-aminocyclopropane-1-carboxylate deaminase